MKVNKKSKSYNRVDNRIGNDCIQNKMIRNRFSKPITFR